MPLFRLLVTFYMPENAPQDVSIIACVFVSLEIYFEQETRNDLFGLPLALLPVVKMESDAVFLFGPPGVKF